MRKQINIDGGVYDRLKTYTNNFPHRSKKKVSFSEAINKLLNFREGE